MMQVKTGGESRGDMLPSKGISHLHYQSAPQDMRSYKSIPHFSHVEGAGNGSQPLQIWTDIGKKPIEFGTASRSTAFGPKTGL